MQSLDSQLAEVRRTIEAMAPENRRKLLLWLQELEPEDALRGGRRRKPKAPVTLRQAVLWSLLSLAAFFLVDAVIFRSGWYLSYLEPDSTTGQLESQLFWLRHELPTKTPEVAVVGDSRIAEGFGARDAGAAVSNTIHFWNLGVPGSSPRVWYYFLRDGDPTRRRFQSIVLGIDHYPDEDGSENMADRTMDLNYLIGRLRLADCLDFAESYTRPGLGWQVAGGCLFRGATLRRDVQDLLAHPKARFAAAKEWRNKGHGYIDGYPGKNEDLSGLTADFARGAAHFPPGAQPGQKRTALSTLFPVTEPQTGAQTAYRKRWLGGILNLYKDSPTRLIFLELPRAPLPTPELPAPARFLNAARRRPRVTVLPKETFRDLERPEDFADGLHLNHLGRPVFSTRLALKVADILRAR